MKLSALQKYILKQAGQTKDKTLAKAAIEQFYQGYKKRPTPQDILTIITRSVERLIADELVVGYGSKTAHRWYIRQVKLTPQGRKLAKGLFGVQQRLPLKNLKGKGASLLRLLAGYGPEDITNFLQPFKNFTFSSEKNENNHIEILRRQQESLGIKGEVALPRHYEFDSVIPGIPSVDRKAPYTSVTFYTPEGGAVLTVQFGMKGNQYILQTDFEGEYHKRAFQKVVMDTKAYLLGNRLTPPKFLPIAVREVHLKGGYRWKYASFGERLTVSSSLTYDHVLPGIFKDSETGKESLAIWLPDDCLDNNNPYEIFELDERHKFRKQAS